MTALDTLKARLLEVDDLSNAAALGPDHVHAARGRARARSAACDAVAARARALHRRRDRAAAGCGGEGDGGGGIRVRRRLARACDPAQLGTVGEDADRARGRVPGTLGEELPGMDRGAAEEQL